MGHFVVMAPQPTDKQGLANVKQGNNKLDRAYLERFDKRILEGEPISDEAKLLAAVAGLKRGLNYGEA